MEALFIFTISHKGKAFSYLFINKNEYFSSYNCVYVCGIVCVYDTPGVSE